MFSIGLTGGIASGKSAVADRFAALGADIVDTDVVAREVTAPGSEALTEIRAQFGDEVVDASGALDRAAMRRLVFGDPASRQKLESILHPRIRARTRELMAASAGPYVIVAVPLLVETGFSEFVDRVLVVDCEPEVQIDRLMRRDGIAEPYARAILDAQADRATRLAAADDVIDNSGGLDRLVSQVELLHSRYLKLAADCSQA